MTHNPILEELYAIREKLLADAGGDIKKYLAGVREREVASGLLLKSVVRQTNQDSGTATTSVSAVEYQPSPLTDR